jgi:hypothetical protein
MPALLSAAVVLCGVESPPAFSKTVQSFKKRLEGIEDGLRSGRFELQRGRCDELVQDLISSYANGKGARPLFGLAFAFRAIAEAGLGYDDKARWDWSVARSFSTAATSFDLQRLGEGGAKLAAALSREEAERTEPLDDRDILRGRVPPKKVSGGEIKYPRWARESQFEGSVGVQIAIDARGNPARLEDAEESDLDEHTAILATILESVRHWHYTPMIERGKPVPCFFWVVVRFRLGGIPMWSP